MVLFPITFSETKKFFGKFAEQRSEDLVRIPVGQNITSVQIPDQQVFFSGVFFKELDSDLPREEVIPEHNHPYGKDNPANVNVDMFHNTYWAKKIPA